MPTVPEMVSQQLGLLSSGAEPTDVRSGQSFIKPGTLAIQSGTMPDNGYLGVITPGTTNQSIPAGYTSGGTVRGDTDLIASNIRAGTEIFDVVGTAILATGNAVDANVLTGVSYSNSSGARVGTMPNNGALGTITPGVTAQSIPPGYTSGGTVAGSASLLPGNIKSGTTIFGVQGNVIQATGTATANQLLIGQTASTTIGPITGTMPDNGSLGTIVPGTTNQSIPAGYTTGGTVAGSGNLQAGNIRLGVTVFGVTGSLDPGTQTGGTAQPGEVLLNKTFTNDSGVQTGSMPNNGAVAITPSSTSQPIPIGYHDGTGTVAAVTFDDTKVLTGTTIAGTAGTMANNGAVTIVPGNTAKPITVGYHNGSGTVSAVTFDATKVLAGTTIAGTAGTMINQGAGGTVTPGTTNQTKAAGYYSSAITISGSANLLAANIKNGINIFGVVGTLTEGSRSATGTTTSSASLTYFYNSGGTEVTAYAVILSWGLTFTPSRVIVRQTTAVANDQSTIYDSSVPMSSGFRLLNYAQNQVRIDGTSCYATSSGIRVPVTAANISFTWYAYE
ncbi:hypothetical protein B2I21_35165 [Chryseobacterium mucoviscidosis]|nr:hypothetical protein B2I21_35165 [Chryseobacterium mucoviscidosis]